MANGDKVTGMLPLHLLLAAGYNEEYMWADELEEGQIGVVFGAVCIEKIGLSSTKGSFRSWPLRVKVFSERRTFGGVLHRNVADSFPTSESYVLMN